jgi:hypothetical protein
MVSQDRTQQQSSQNVLGGWWVICGTTHPQTRQRRESIYGICERQLLQFPAFDDGSNILNLEETDTAYLRRFLPAVTSTKAVVMYGR